MAHMVVEAILVIGTKMHIFFSDIHLAPRTQFNPASKTALRKTECCRKSRPLSETPDGYPMAALTEGGDQFGQGKTLSQPPKQQRVANIFC
jgi:hypothetical protein